MNRRNVQKLLYKQPIICPWNSSQPYQSTLLNKNRNSTQTDPSITKHSPTNPRMKKEQLLNISRKHFFYFLRFMQLFPDIHPATIHTVINLYKDDFVGAVDKLLFAKRYKILFDKKNSKQKLIISRDNRCSPIQQNNMNIATNQNTNVSKKEQSHDKTIENSDENLR